MRMRSLRIALKAGLVDVVIDNKAPSRELGAIGLNGANTASRHFINSHGFKNHCGAQKRTTPHGIYEYTP